MKNSFLMPYFIYLIPRNIPGFILVRSKTPPPHAPQTAGRSRQRHHVAGNAAGNATTRQATRQATQERGRQRGNDKKRARRPAALQNGRAPPHFVFPFLSLPRCLPRCLPRSCVACRVAWWRCLARCLPRGGVACCVRPSGAVGWVGGIFRPKTKFVQG